jgi:ketosteroid isomerase-like protein
VNEPGLEARADDSRRQGANAQSLLKTLRADRHMDQEAFISLLHEDVVWDMSRSPFPDAHVYRGVGGVREWFDSLASVFGDVAYEIERVREVGDRVAQLIRVGGRGRGSGVPVDYRFAPVMTFRSGKIVRMDRYDDWPEAMAAIEPPG